MDFQTVARPHHIKGLPAERKMQILPLRPSIQVDTQGVSPQDPRMFQTDLGSLDLSCRGNMMEQMFGCCFDFPCECGTPPYGQGLRGHCH